MHQINEIFKDALKAAFIGVAPVLLICLLLSVQSGCVVAAPLNHKADVERYKTAKVMFMPIMEQSVKDGKTKLADYDAAKRWMKLWKRDIETREANQ